MTRFLLKLLPVAMIALLLPSLLMGQATLVIINMDGPGEGFNDPTPAAPVGGNPGTTVGQQRLNAFQFAADIWGSTLTSDATIKIQASFNPLPCTLNSGVLGSAGPIQILANFPGAEFPNTWYAVALANKRAGEDLIPGADGTSADDIRARFNSSLNGTNPDGSPCLTGIGWYYGYDGNEGNGIDLVAVLLHEFAHGLGFLSVVDDKTGTSPKNWTDVYSRNIQDNSSGLRWDGMTPSQRRKSAVNTGNVVWSGANVTAASPHVLGFSPVLFVNSPASLAGIYAVGTASFGGPITDPGATGDLVLVNDGSGTLTDGCQAFGGVAGKIALIDRGTCAFTVKATNAFNAGAFGVVIANNVAGAPPGMSGSAPGVTIPVVSVSLDTGNLLKNGLALGTVNVTIGLDTSHRAGADASGHVLLYAPNPIEPGSSISHWDTSTLPNQLMEPAINRDLTHSVTVPEDLTFELFKDIGW